MSYRCQVCKGECPPRQPRLTHVVKRKDGSILTEYAVCAACQAALAAGAKPSDLLPKPATPEPASDVPPTSA